MNLMFRSSSVPISPAADGRAADRRFRLRRGGYKWALTAHIVSSVGWFGVALVVAFCVLAASMTGNSSLAHSLYRTIELFPWLSVPIGILAAATGAFLALGTSYGLIRRWWVVVKIVIATAVVTTDTVLVGRFAHTAATTGHARPSLYGSTVIHVPVLIFAAILSVFKPWGLTPWARRRPNALDASAD
jgi:uncharacterized membrane protein